MTTMTATTVPDQLAPRVRWSWLWTPRADLLGNLLPFWIGFALVAALYATRGVGFSPDQPIWTLVIGGRTVSVMSVLLFLYGPLVDAPHLWATIARTYTDREEWATRRRLLLGSLAIFLIGPVVILLPYALRALGALPARFETVGWQTWTLVLGFYALFHINRQHWGFVALYKRRNADLGHAAENRVDSLFFQIAIWLPYLAMLTAPWFQVVEIPAISALRGAVGSTNLFPALHVGCHAAFLAMCVAYALFQVRQWRKGIERNGPKLVYMATILSLYYVTFALHPRIATFWILITGTDHCAQYHAVVWAYGKKKYLAAEQKLRGLPSVIFGNLWLYAALGLAFGLLTMQGPGAGIFKRAVAHTLESGMFSWAFTFLDPNAGRDLGLKVAAAIVSSVRVHHFYVDSKIWRVGKSPALAKNLNV